MKGQVVLITRPRKQAKPLADALRRRGDVPRLAPAIRIAGPSSWRALDRSLRRLEEYRAVVFTSVNGVEGFFARAGRVLKGKPRLAGRVYAIGPATAKALARRGVRAAPLPERYEGEALARQLLRRLGRVEGSRILLPRARVARDVLPKVLEAAGAVVDDVETYRTLPDLPGRKALKRAVLRGDDCVVTFTSPSTVHQFVDAVGRARARRFFKTAKAASIGPVTSAALRGYGIRPAVQAEPYTAEGLVRALGRFNGGRE